MRAGFILDFLSEAISVAGGLPSLFLRESMHFKELRLGGYNPEKIYSGYRNLARRGIITFDSAASFKFTKFGREWLRVSYLKYMRHLHPRWDGTWRIVIFDIPQDKHMARNRLRQKIRNLGFYMLQKSVFVFPYPCEDELGLICRSYGVSKYVDVIEARTLGSKEIEIKRFYQLS